MSVIPFPSPARDHLLQLEAVINEIRGLADALELIDVTPHKRRRARRDAFATLHGILSDQAEAATKLVQQIAAR